jgi:hypothetical protein
MAQDQDGIIDMKPSPPGLSIASWYETLHGRGHALPKVLAGPAMPYPSKPCGRPLLKGPSYCLLGYPMPYEPDPISELYSEVDR